VPGAQESRARTSIAASERLQACLNQGPPRLPGRLSIPTASSLVSAGCRGGEGGSFDRTVLGQPLAAGGSHVASGSDTASEWSLEEVEEVIEMLSEDVLLDEFPLSSGGSSSASLSDARGDVAATAGEVAQLGGRIGQQRRRGHAGEGMGVAAEAGQGRWEAQGRQKVGRLGFGAMDGDIVGVLQML
jgi:hypothetical protein